MTSLRKKYVIGSLMLVLIVSALTYVFVYRYAVPKSAVWAVPYKWRSFPLGEKRSIVQDYLGAPLSQTQQIPGYDRWQSGPVKQNYLLTVYYTTPDSIANSYSVYYHHRGMFVTRRYLMDSFALPPDSR
ncbi:hypothetical protein [Sediminibacterium ginsengisoli]|uniref:Uncharacterized protein n=1 Tax=Sediminibacterium ginsengisoli TaxID=413434 RepID=A0A1T4R9K8_9BACT|nr:hypothetical protein [Sediminibacterium ginsengisoli]SKA12358.1 hypothetical protein SAMN04488132_11131 [Sediminibacterium ginsengisoli]